MSEPRRPVPNNAFGRRYLKEMPADTTPGDWAQLEIGFARTFSFKMIDGDREGCTTWRRLCRVRRISTPS
jgi:hypothetical protein